MSGQGTLQLGGLGLVEMSGQKYKRTNFEEDETTSQGGTPPGVTYDPNIAFKAGATFWQKRTLFEKLLIVLSVTLTLVVVALSIVVGTHQHVTPPPVTGESASTTKSAPPPTPETRTAKPEPELCLTKACVSVASSILNSMDDSVDACSDFYQYACGGWVKAHPIPSGQSRWGTFSVMDKQNQIVIKNELEIDDPTNPSKAELKAKKYYGSCMDPNKTIEALGASPLIKVLQEHGGWNLSARTGGWSLSNFSLQEMVQKVHGLGMSPLFYIGVGEDEKDVEKNILQIDQSGLGLARDQYINKTIDDDKDLSAYLKYMTDIGVLLGGSLNETNKQMRKVVQFEQDLANITTPMEERRDDEKLYHRMTISKLQQKAPFINWRNFTNNHLGVTTYNYTVSDSENVLVYAPEFLKKLTTLLTELTKTDEGKMVLHNYFMWHVIKGLSIYLSKPFQDARKEFMEVLTGVSGEEEQWRYCTADANGVMGFAVGAMFIRKTFHGASKTEAELMIYAIKTAFTDNFVNLQWMDPITRRAAVSKANAVKNMIGFPEFILNKTALDERYKNLKINESEYFQNNLNSLSYSINRNLDKLRKPPENDSWSMSPSTVNAYYTPTKNEIVFPAGILQAPFFDQAYPKSINFGGMGVVMGHELTHGFDDQGREYDENGYLRPWWNTTTIEKFKNQTQCMIDQYSSYKINDDFVKGKQTLGENIADNGGLKASYHAYEQWIVVNGEERLLPGVEHSHRQLFFLAFAQVWCSNTKPEYDHIAILTDPHSPSRFRVTGPLSNSRDFATQFNCPMDSPMNPTDKCDVW